MPAVGNHGLVTCAKKHQVCARATATEHTHTGVPNCFATEARSTPSK